MRSSSKSSIASSKRRSARRLLAAYFVAARLGHALRERMNSASAASHASFSNAARPFSKSFFASPWRASLSASTAEYAATAGAAGVGAAFAPGLSACAPGEEAKRRAPRAIASGCALIRTSR